MSESGKGVVRDIEVDPADATNRCAVQAALFKLLRNDNGAASELRSLLIQAGARSVQGDIAVTATHSSVAVGGSIIGSTIAAGPKPQP
jgi:exosome complex RNA-binding protein Rrp42 (RNase PH superfamily)